MPDSANENLPRTVGTMPDGTEIEMSQEFSIWLNDRINGLAAGSLRNVVAGTNSIFNGTAILADVQIQGQGSVTANQNTQAANTAAAAAEAAESNGNISVSVSPNTAYGAEQNNENVTTNTVTLTISDGVAPYIVSWAVDNGDITINSPAAETTAFSATVPVDESVTGTATATVTDSTPGTPMTASVSVSVSLYNGGFQ